MRHPQLSVTMFRGDASNAGKLLPLGRAQRGALAVTSSTWTTTANAGGSIRSSTQRSGRSCTYPLWGLCAKGLVRAR